MCLVVKQGKLTPEERNFLSVAYKNVVGARRSAWRVLQSLESKGGSSEELLKGYKAKVEEELKKHCNEVIVSFNKIYGGRCVLIFIMLLPRANET